MSIAAKGEELVEDLGMFDNWDDKWSYVIDLGKAFPLMEDEFCTEDNIVYGCQNKVYIRSLFDGKNVHFEGNSEAMIPRGLLGLLIKVLGNEKPENILTAELDFIDRAGIRDNLSMLRANGLEAMMRRMKLEAVKYIRN